jgi:hypothetical protein
MPDAQAFAIVCSSFDAAGAQMPHANATTHRKGKRHWRIWAGTNARDKGRATQSEQPAPYFKARFTFIGMHNP